MGENEDTSYPSMVIADGEGLRLFDAVSSRDAKFIAAARTALPELLDEVERQGKEIADWQEIGKSAMAVSRMLDDAKQENERLRSVVAEMETTGERLRALLREWLNVQPAGEVPEKDWGDYELRVESALKGSGVEP